jgi:hypothetical protein
VPDHQLMLAHTRRFGQTEKKDVPSHILDQFRLYLWWLTIHADTQFFCKRMHKCS